MNLEAKYAVFRFLNIIINLSHILIKYPNIIIHINNYPRFVHIGWIYKTALRPKKKLALVPYILQIRLARWLLFKIIYKFYY